MVSFRTYSPDLAERINPSAIIVLLPFPEGGVQGGESVLERLAVFPIAFVGRILNEFALRIHLISFLRVGITIAKRKGGGFRSKLPHSLRRNTQ